MFSTNLTNFIRKPRSTFQIKTSLISATPENLYDTWPIKTLQSFTHKPIYTTSNRQIPFPPHPSIFPTHMRRSRALSIVTPRDVSIFPLSCAPSERLITVRASVSNDAAARSLSRLRAIFGCILSYTRVLTSRVDFSPRWERGERDKSFPDAGGSLVYIDAAVVYVQRL